MTKSQTEVQRLSAELDRIAARLAGVESIIRQNINDPDGNSLSLLADVAYEANNSISNCADKLRNVLGGVA